MEPVSSSSACQFTNRKRLFEIFMPADLGLQSIGRCGAEKPASGVGAESPSRRSQQGIHTPSIVLLKAATARLTAVLASSNCCSVLLLIHFPHMLRILLSPTAV